MRSRLQEFCKRPSDHNRTVSSDRAGPVGARAFPPETSAGNLVMCVRAAHGLLWACGRTGGCGLEGRRAATRARAEVDDECELVPALLRGTNALLGVASARGRRGATNAIFVLLREREAAHSRGCALERGRAREGCAQGEGGGVARERGRAREAARSQGGAFERRRRQGKVARERRAPGALLQFERTRTS